jgi:glycosyltransferase involved in cell wall biosynthesis
MQVALFTECYHPTINGVVVSVSIFARELAKQGHDVHIYAPAYAGHRDTEPNVHRLYSLPPPRSIHYPLALPFGTAFLDGVFTKYPPDIVHANHPFLTGREARRLARRRACPLVFTYHTIIRDYAHYVPLPGALVRRLAVWVSREFSNSADCVVVPTRAVADLLRSYGVTRRIEVIPTGIDLDLIASTPRRSVRPRWSVPPEAPVVCYSGRIAKEKNLTTLLRAFALVTEAFADVHLLLVGGGPWEAACREMIGALGLEGRVHLTGYVSRAEVFDCLADSTVFAFPSLTDTQGLVVLEAMAVGCPSVALRSGAVEDVIREEVDGLIVEPSVETLAEGIKRLLASEDLRRRLAGQARQRAEEFSAGNMALRLSQVYSSLLGESAAVR